MTNRAFSENCDIGGAATYVDHADTQLTLVVGQN